MTFQELLRAHGYKLAWEAAADLGVSPGRLSHICRQLDYHRPTAAGPQIWSAADVDELRRRMRAKGIRTLRDVDAPTPDRTSVA